MGYFLVVFLMSPDYQKMEMLGLFTVHRLKQSCLLNRTILAVFRRFFCLAAPKSPSRLVEKVVTTSAGFPTSVSGGNATSGLVYTSGNAAKIRPPRTCELRTMEVVVSKRLTLMNMSL